MNKHTTMILKMNFAGNVIIHANFAAVLMKPIVKLALLAGKDTLKINILGQ
jgi:hypothetical protein